MKRTHARRAGGVPIPILVLVLVAAPLAGAPANAPAQPAAAPADSARAHAAPPDTAAALPVFSLARCVEVAVQSSNTLAVAEQNRLSAGQGVKGAWGAFLPNLSVSHSYGKSIHRDFDVANPDTLVGGTFTRKIRSSSRDFGAQSSLNVFDGLRKYGNLKSARGSLHAAEATAAYDRQQTIQNTVAAYFDLLRYERLLDVAVESRELAAKELERTEVYFKLGSAAKSDVLQATVRLEQTKLAEVQARNAAEQAFSALAYAMNQPLRKRFEIERSALNTDFAVGDLDLLYGEALSHRYDLQALQYQLESREGDVTAAGSGLWPSLNLSVNYDRSKTTSPYIFGSQQADNLSYGYQVNWNIFDRMQTLTGRSQAKAQQRIAEYSLYQARLDAQLEIRQLYNAIVEARERAQLSHETIAQADEALRLAQERFRVGAGTTLDIITAQVNLSTARSDEVQAICDYLINSAKLDRAVGRPVRYLGGAS